MGIGLTSPRSLPAACKCCERVRKGMGGGGRGGGGGVVARAF